MAFLRTHAHTTLLPPLGDPKELAAWIWLRRRGDLTNWERDFVAGVMVQRSAISPRQEKCLAGIASQLGLGASPHE